ncbi:MAG: hypothetical protein M1826_001595 [Phylliscum demangeonii]|nr:MAG: hypothetical protein M1826_001595 [Phylliscum demangeonii]
MESQRQRYLQNLDRDIVELTYKRQLENIRRWHTESVRAARKRLEEQKAEWHHASPPPNHLEDTKDADAYNQRLLQEELTNLLVNSRAREIHAYTSRTLQPRLGRSPEDAQEDFDKRMRAIVDANLAGDRNAHTRHEARTVRARRTRAKAQAQAPAQASAQEASEAETSAAPPSSAPHQFSLHSMGALGRRMGRLVTPMRKWATGLVGSFSRSGQKSLNSGQMERVLLES